MRIFKLQRLLLTAGINSLMSLIVCPTVFYPGFIAGAYYSHKGGGGEYICLPNQPK